MFKIAIDGPAGSGKSTIAKAVAEQLNFHYLSTGKFYRTYAYIIATKQIDVPTLLATMAQYQIKINSDSVYLNNVDISNYLYDEKIGNLASQIAVDHKIREIAVEQQRQMAQHNNVIMDGRDIGTIVLPDAQLKIFLIASPQVRALRRIKELNLDMAMLDEIKNEIQERDARDMNREIAPLKKATDAIEIDSSEMSIQQVVNQIIKLYQERT